MADDATIILRFLKTGDAEFIAGIKRLTAEMETAIPVSSRLADRLAQLYQQKKISSQELMAVSSRLVGIEKQLAAEERKRQQTIGALVRENARYNAELSKQDAQMAKVAARTREINMTPLGRFTSGLYGGAGGLDKFERSAYDASRQAALFSRSLATAPIATLGAFTRSTQKAAIASQFLKEQLAFIAASRFGAIMIGFAIFGTIAKGIREAVEATAEMDKAVHRAASAFLDVQNPAAYYAQIQREIQLGAVMTGKSFSDVAEVLWELKSAGLSTAETFAFVDANLKLSTLNAAKMEKTIRLTAGLYRTFGDDIEGATTPMEKMSYVANVLVYALNRSADDMPGIMNAYKYVSSTAGIAGVSLEEVTASIITLNNHMIHSGIAGRSYNQTLIHLATNSKKIADIFNLELDPSKPLQFAEVMEQLSRSPQVAEMSLDRLAVTMESFGVRGGRAFAVLIKHSDEWLEAYRELPEEVRKNPLDALFAIQMDNITDQWTRFKQVVGTALIMEDAGAQVKDTLKTINDLAEAWLRVQNAVENTRSSTEKAVAKAQEMQRPFSGIAAGAQETARIFPLIARYLKEGSGWLARWVTGTGNINAGLAEAATIEQQMSAIIASSLTDKEKFAIEVAKGNVSLQGQLTFHKGIVKEMEMQLALELKAGKSSAERAEVIEALVKAYRQVGSLEKQIASAAKQEQSSRDKLARQQKKFNDELRKSIEFSGDIAVAFIRAKEETPLREVREMAQGLQNALNIVRATAYGTQEWNQAVTRTLYAYNDIANVHKVIEKAVDAVISKTQQLQSIGGSYVDELLKQGQEGMASSIAREMLQYAQASLDAAKTDAQRLQANQLMLTALEAQAKAGDDAAWKVLETKRQMWEIQKKIVEESQKDLGDVQAEELKRQIDGIKSSAEQTLKALPGWEAHISNANREADAMKQNLDDVRMFVGDINSGLGEMAGNIRNMPSVNLGGTGTADFLTDAGYN